MFPRNSNADDDDMVLAAEHQAPGEGYGIERDCWVGQDDDRVELREEFTVSGAGVTVTTWRGTRQELREACREAQLLPGQEAQQVWLTDLLEVKHQYSDHENRDRPEQRKIGRDVMVLPNEFFEAIQGVLVD